jgi:spermidine synthase
MTPRTLLASARIPGTATDMNLYRRGADHMILVDRDELMSSRMSGSEEALAELTADRLGARPRQHWLIGGYGMGFTLRAALRRVAADARVTIAELVPEIIDWARGPMADLSADCLTDPRTLIRIGDVADAIAQAPAGFDAILLDVDNGPDALVRPGNRRLYAPAGLAAARAALRPGGVLAVWSAGPDPGFTRTLGEAGFAVDEQIVRARSNGKGPRHHIWFATPGPSPIVGNADRRQASPRR